MASAVAQTIATTPDIGSFQPVTVGTRTMHSESSRQGVQHLRIIKHLQPVTNRQPGDHNGGPEKNVSNH